MYTVFMILLLMLTPGMQSKAPDLGNPNTKVWVDTGYGFYHCPQTRFYGHTRQGVYMTQKEAQGRGYRPANGVCR